MDGGTLSVLMAAVTMLGATLSGLFAWLASRDKLKYDLKIQTLETKVADCEGRHAEQAAKNRDLDAINRQQNARLQGLASSVVAVSKKVDDVTPPPAPEAP